MRAICAGLAAVLLGVAGGATAQETGHERAEALIADAGAADLFENVTEAGDDVATVRHRATGMTCAYPKGMQGEIMVITQVLPRGEDVGCDLQMPEVTVTLYATRAHGASMPDELEGASEMIRMRWPDAEPWAPTGSADTLIPPDRRSPQVDQGTRWFIAEEEGKPLVTRVSVAAVGDWIIKMRATSWTQTHAEVMEMLSSMVWYSNLEEMAKAPPAPAS